MVHGQCIIVLLNVASVRYSSLLYILHATFRKMTFMIDKKTQNAMDAVTKLENTGTSDDKHFDPTGSVRNGSVINMPTALTVQEEIPDKGPIPRFQRWVVFRYKCSTKIANSKYNAINEYSLCEET